MLFILYIYICCCCSIAKSCPTLLRHHGLQLPELAQTHVHWVSDAVQPSHPLSFPSPPALNLSQHQGLFQWVGSSHQVAKVLELQLQHQSFQWIFILAICTYQEASGTWESSCPQNTFSLLQGQSGMQMVMPQCGWVPFCRSADHCATKAPCRGPCPGRGGGFWVIISYHGIQLSPPGWTGEKWFKVLHFFTREVFILTTQVTEKQYAGILMCLDFTRLKHFHLFF